MTRNQQSNEPTFQEAINVLKDNIKALFSNQDPLALIKAIPANIGLIKELIDNFVKKHFEEEVEHLKKSDPNQVSEQIAILEKKYTDLEQELNTSIGALGSAVKTIAQSQIDIGTYKERAQTAIDTLKAGTETIKMPSSFKDASEYFEFLGKIEKIDALLDNLHERYLNKVKATPYDSTAIHNAYSDYVKLKTRLAMSQEKIQGHPPIAIGFFDLFLWSKSNFFSRFIALIWGATIIDKKYIAKQDRLRNDKIIKAIRSKIAEISKTNDPKDENKLRQLQNHLQIIQEPIAINSSSNPTPKQTTKEIDQKFVTLKALSGQLSTIFGKSTGWGGIGIVSGTLRDFFKEIQDAKSLEQLTSINKDLKKDDSLIKLQSELASNEESRTTFNAFITHLNELEGHIEQSKDKKDIFSKLKIERVVKAVEIEPEKLTPLIIQEEAIVPETQPMPPLVEKINQLLSSKSSKKTDIATEIANHILSNTEINFETFSKVKILLTNTQLNFSVDDRKEIIANLGHLEVLLHTNTITLQPRRFKDDASEKLRDLFAAIILGENQVTQNYNQELASKVPEIKTFTDAIASESQFKPGIFGIGRH